MHIAVELEAVHVEASVSRLPWRVDLATAETKRFVIDAQAAHCTTLVHGPAPDTRKKRKYFVCSDDKAHV